MTSTETAARDDALAWLAGRLELERLFTSLRVAADLNGGPVDLDGTVDLTDIAPGTHDTEPAAAEAA